MDSEQLLLWKVDENKEDADTLKLRWESQA